MVEVTAFEASQSVGLFYDTVSTSDRIASSGRIINEWCIGKDLKGIGRGVIEAGRTEEKHENPQPGKPAHLTNTSPLRYTNLLGRAATPCWDIYQPVQRTFR
jgi:hypothetical protein